MLLGRLGVHCPPHKPVVKTQAMRTVVQRVKKASVKVDGNVVSAIGPGLVCLVGLKSGSTDKDAEFICRRILNCRLWPAREGKKSWDESVVQREYEVLLISQFTLYGYCKGNKPDFHLAMPPKEAEESYTRFVQRVKQSYSEERVKDGIFGAMMDVELVNDVCMEDFQVYLLCLLPTSKSEMVEMRPAAEAEMMQSIPS